MRTKRTDGNTTYTYFYDGSNLHKMKVGSDTLTFIYGSNGHPMAVKYNYYYYYYVTNTFGDVLAILDDEGAEVVAYSYDAWGNILSTSGSMASTVGAYNPLRYRGYVYDNETGLYYLQSRYYNPVICRFVNADIFVSTGQGALGYNMFAYCNNNPVKYVDHLGLFGLCVLDDPMNVYRAFMTPGMFGSGGGGNTAGYTRVYRSVSSAEAQDIKNTGKFNLFPGGMESKQFGFSLSETKQFGNMVGQTIIVGADVPNSLLGQLYTGGVDTSIFHAGTLTVYKDMLSTFNREVSGSIVFIP